MKRSIFGLTCVFLLLNVLQGYSQDFKKFRIGLGAGYATGIGNGSSGGALAAIEPSYRITDAIAIGFRMETAAITRGYSVSALYSGLNFGATVIESYTLNGQYYFSNHDFRPFVGMGIGIYQLDGVEIDYQSQTAYFTIPAESSIGFYPRIGFDSGHFTMAIEYNFISDADIEGTDVKVDNSYLGIRLGGFFFGGRKL